MAAPARHDNRRAKSIHIRLHKRVGKRGEPLLDSRRKTDPEDLAEAGFIDVKVPKNKAMCFLRPHKSRARKSSGNCLGDHRSDRDTADPPAKFRNKENIQSDIQAAADDQEI